MKKKIKAVIYRPLIMKHTALENHHFVDYFYPTFWHKGRRKRIYFEGENNVGFRKFITKNEAKEFIRKVRITEI